MIGLVDCEHDDTYVQIVVDFDQRRVYELETCHDCGEELQEVVTGEDLSESWAVLHRFCGEVRGMPEVFWIGEVCDADQRAKLITDESKRWFATRTIEQAIASYNEKVTAATVTR